MDYLTRYYKNLCEDIQRKINLLSEELSQKIMDEVRSTLATTRKLDTEKKARRSRVNPLTGKSLEQAADENKRALEQRKIDSDARLQQDMPNLAARVKFSRLTRSGLPISDEETNKFNLGPEERKSAELSTALTPKSDLHAFMSLSPDERNIVAPTLNRNVLRGMEQEQYNQSANETLFGRGNKKLGADKVSALNLIGKTIEDKSGPLGGKAGADSYFRRIQRNERDYQSTDEVKTSYEDSQKAFAGKTYDELDAMQQAGHKAVKKLFGDVSAKRGYEVKTDTIEDDTMDPDLTPEELVRRGNGAVAAVKQIQWAKDNLLAQKTTERENLMKSREENARKMYGDQWMKYM